MKALPRIRKKPTEAQLWRRVRKDLDRDYDRAYRIEAINTPGFPDVVWIPYKKFPALIELKAGPLLFRAAQRKLIKDLHYIGTTVWVIWQPQLKEAPVVWRGIELLQKPCFGDTRGFAYHDWVERMREIIE